MLRDLASTIVVGDDTTPGGLIGLLVGGSFLAFLGALLSARSGRQRHFDQRMDKELTRLRGRNDELEDENDRFRAYLAKQGIDPEEVIREPPRPAR